MSTRTRHVWLYCKHFKKCKIFDKTQRKFFSVQEEYIYKKKQKQVNIIKISVCIIHKE